MPLIPDMDGDGDGDVDFNGLVSTAAVPRSKRAKGKSSKKVRLQLDMDDNPDDQGLLLDNDPTFLEELNQTDRVGDSGTDAGDFLFTSSSEKPRVSSAKKAKITNQYFSSPATILRATAPSNMSPDMILAQKKPGCNCKKSKCLKL